MKVLYWLQMDGNKSCQGMFSRRKKIGAHVAVDEVDAGLDREDDDDGELTLSDIRYLSSK
jgi:hypothetical protein